MSQNSLTLPTTGTVSGLQMTQAANNALDMLNTLASGASAPGSPEAGQLWHDTTNNILKLRSLDNTSWIKLFNLNETAYTAQPNNIAVAKAITGCLPTAMSGTNTTAAITISSGSATDFTNAFNIISAGYSWAASNGNAINGTDAASSTLANSTTYHMFLCSGTSGTGTFASASLTPTLPSGYNSYSRRIFSFNTTSAGAPVSYTALETEGGSITAWLGTQLLDINSSSLTSSARTFYTLTVPSGIKVGVMYRASSATNISIILTSGDESDVATVVNGDWTTVPGFDFFYGSNVNVATVLSSPRDGLLTTNTSGQIGARAQTGSSNTFYFVTRGFKDWRRS